MPRPPPKECSFCMRKREKVNYLVGSPHLDVAICDRCAVSCVEQIGKATADKVRLVRQANDLVSAEPEEPQP